MIKTSFIFLERIRKNKEQSLWSQGIKDWPTFLNTSKIRGIAPAKKAYYNRKIHEAQQALHHDNSAYFTDKLPSTQTWRLYDYFKDDACFLDIEIDSYDRINLIGISNYYQTNHFVQTINLTKPQIEQELAKYKLVITFNGASFDLPKIQKQLHLTTTIPHIDLKPLCQKLNLLGGLKEVEKTLNLKRPPHLYGNPVDLWKAFHASGDKEYLDLLLQYNAQDIENLKAIMEYCYKKMKERISCYNLKK